jgi:thiol-disulfide isomerase/thioredoxin
MKEVEVFGIIMANKFHRSRMRQPFAIMIVICFLIQLGAGISQAEVKNFDEEWNEEIAVAGGRTVLVEELSATWCVSCAEIDPYLQQVADAHGSRISIVTYHPSDGEDAFQPAAAKHRIERMKLVNPQIGATPSFVVESGLLRIGPDSWPDVQKDILKAETNRQEVSKLAFTIAKDGNNYSASISNIELMEVSYETQITFLLMNHGVEMPDGFFNPGESHRDRVVIATSSCNIGTNVTQNIGFLDSTATDCLSDFTVNFTNDGKFSVILIHEATNEVLLSSPNLANSLGVVEFAYRDIEIQSETNIMPIVFLSIISIGCIWALIDKKSN